MADLGATGGRRYVVVSGPPASGKSTLAPALAAELGLPLLAKDTIKHVLMDRIWVPDLQTSRRLGGAAIAVLLTVARDCPAAVLESVWHRSRAAADLVGLGAPVVEVFCRVPEAVAAARHGARAGTRGPGHFDHLRRPDELWNDEVAQPVADGWPLIEVDTTAPVDVPALVAAIRAALDAIPAEVVVREAEPPDEGALAVVHHETVVTAYAPLFPISAPVPTTARLEAEWSAAIADPDETVLVAESAGRLVGMVAVRPDVDDDTVGQLRRLHVQPGWWGLGIGTRLHDEALGRLGDAGFARAALWVLEGNVRARAMYERRGWREVPDAVLSWPGLGVEEVRYERHL